MGGTSSCLSGRVRGSSNFLPSPCCAQGRNKARVACGRLGLLSSGSGIGVGSGAAASSALTKELPVPSSPIGLAWVLSEESDVPNDQLSKVPDRPKRAWGNDVALLLVGDGAVRSLAGSCVLPGTEAGRLGPWIAELDLLRLDASLADVRRCALGALRSGGPVLCVFAFHLTDKSYAFFDRTLYPANYRAMEQCCALKSSDGRMRFAVVYCLTSERDRERWQSASFVRGIAADYPACLQAQNPAVLVVGPDGSVVAGPDLASGTPSPAVAP